MKKSALLNAVILLLSLVATASGQITPPGVYVDMSEVTGLAPDGKIPANGGNLTIPVRFHNVDDNRTAISNGYGFSGDVSFSNITGEWNPAYCFTLPWIGWCPGCYPPECYPYFDQGVFINYFNVPGDPDPDIDGVGFAGLSGASGIGLPADFEGIAYFITLTNVQGPPGAVLTMDSTWWEPANFWAWSGVAQNVSWGGPYQWEMGSEPCCVPPVITSTPPEGTFIAGDNYSYDVEATGMPDPEFYLSEAPEGMTINASTGQISWVCETGFHEVTVIADNAYPPAASQSFVITVFPDEEPFTTCWPQPIRLKSWENNRILNVIIWNENYDMIDWSTIRVFNIPPYTEVRKDGDSLVTDVAVMRFLGVGGFRPIPSLGYNDAEYTVSYTMLDGTYKELIGLFDLTLTLGDVNFDGMANIEDIILMTDFLFNKGPKANLWNEDMDECMDVDGNARVNLLDVSTLINIVY